jgi:hypothetical protein
VGTENDEPREPQREEVWRLLELIDRTIFASRRSRRSIERDLELGQGYLGSLLSGRITLKVGHVWRLGETLGVEPLLLFFLSASKAHQKRFLKDIGVQVEINDLDLKEHPVTEKEVVVMVHQLLKEELRRAQRKGMSLPPELYELFLQEDG